MMRAVRARLRGCGLASLAFMAFMTLACGPALAHKGSDAYLDVQQLAPAANQTAAAGTDSRVDFRFSLAVAVRDLDLVAPLDANADASVTWGEVKVATPQVLALLNQMARLDAQPGGQGAGPALLDACRLAWQGDGLERRSDGVYFRAVAQARCLPGQALRLNYALLKEQDSTHRLLVAGRIGGRDLLSTVSPQRGSLLLSAGTGDGTTGNAQAGTTQASSRWATLRDYFGLGMHHLLQGYDHLAFLLALVLPLQLSLRRWPQRVVSRAGSAGATAAYARRAAWLSLLRTVTAFTLGHSITLMLATFGLTQASPLWVEPVIALSIAVTALLNLYPVKGVRFDVLALLFGLVHGFGFAGLLQEAAAPGGLLPWALAGFNLGVEAGQLTAVMGWVLVSQALVGRPWYDRMVVRGGSMVLVLLAAWWFWQRVG
ncbi:HupE/UreJ family protein [soil metagenome]